MLTISDPNSWAYGVGPWSIVSVSGVAAPGQVALLNGATLTFGTTFASIDLDESTIVAHGTPPGGSFPDNAISITYQDSTGRQYTSSSVVKSGGSSFAAAVNPLSILDDQWATSGPRDNGFDIVIFEAPVGTTILEVSIDGGAWSSLGGTAPGIYPVTGLSQVKGYRVEVRANGGAASVKSSRVIPSDPRGFRQWDAGVDLGTSGNVFVAPYGDDANPGTLGAPKLTVGAGVAVANAGQVVKVRAGVYRETVAAKADVSIEGYGAEKPNITGADIVPVMTQADATDAGVLGATLGVNGSPIYKATIPAIAGMADLRALNVHVAGTQYYPPSDRADTSDLFNSEDETTFHFADTLVLNGSSQVTGIVDASVINSARYSAGVLMGASVKLHHSPNVTNTVTITGVDLPNNRIDVDGLRPAQLSGANTANYTIEGLAQGMSPGTFFAELNGGNIDLYVWPIDAVNVDLVEVSTRISCIDLPLLGDNITLRGLHASAPFGDSFGDGWAIRKSSNTNQTSGHLLEHLLVTGAQNVNLDSFGIRLSRVKDSVIRNCTVYETSGFPIMLSGGSVVPGTLTSQFGEGNLIELVHCERGGSAPVRLFTQTDAVVAHSWFKATGRRSHGNKINAYEQCDQVTWWGIEFDYDCFGYATWQEASSIAIGFSYIPVTNKGATDNRGIEDQSNATVPPIAGTNGYIFNCDVHPQPNNTGNGVSVDLDDPQSDMIWQVSNNVMHGITGLAQIPAPTPSVEDNVITLLAFDGTNQTAASHDPSNVIEEDLSLVFADAANNDFTPVAGSPVLTKLGQDKTPEIAILSARHPQFSGWDRDYKNQLIDWTRPPMGADAGLPFV